MPLYETSQTSEKLKCYLPQQLLVFLQLHVWPDSTDDILGANLELLDQDVLRSALHVLSHPHR